MIFSRADSISLTIFTVFAVLMAVAISYAMRIANVSRNWRMAFAAVILAFSFVGISGVLEESFLPFGPILLASGLIFTLVFSFSSAGAKIAATFSFATLIGFQAFRLPLEIILHQWATLGTVPPTMTWTGQNWDVLTGVISLLTFRWVDKNRNLALVTNIVGSLLLFNVLRVVIMSSPVPFGWNLEEPLVLIAYFPYALIGPLFVFPALIAHVVTFRKLYGNH